MVYDPVKQGSRLVVASEPGVDDVVDLYVPREALEGLAARLAASRPTESTAPDAMSCTGSPSAPFRSTRLCRGFDAWLVDPGDLPSVPGA